MNLLKIKCHTCKDELTPKELEFNEDYRQRHGLPPQCWQCNVKELETVKLKQAQKLKINKKI